MLKTRLLCLQEVGRSRAASSTQLQTSRDGALLSTEEPEERPEVAGVARKPTSKGTVGMYRACMHAQVHVAVLRYGFGRSIRPACLIHGCFPSF